MHKHLSKAADDQVVAEADDAAAGGAGGLIETVTLPSIGFQSSAVFFFDDGVHTANNRSFLKMMTPNTIQMIP